MPTTTSNTLPSSSDAVSPRDQCLEAISKEHSTLGPAEYIPREVCEHIQALIDDQLTRHHLSVAEHELERDAIEYVLQQYPIQNATTANRLLKWLCEAKKVGATLRDITERTESRIYESFQSSSKAAKEQGGGRAIQSALIVGSENVIVNYADFDRFRLLKEQRKRREFHKRGEQLLDAIEGNVELIETILEEQDSEEREEILKVTKPSHGCWRVSKA